MSEKFFDLQRFAVINNDLSNAEIITTSSRESITNSWGDTVTIDGVGNDDTISNER